MRLTVFDAKVIGDTGVRLKLSAMVVSAPGCWDDCIFSHTSMIALVASCLSERGGIYTDNTIILLNSLNSKQGRRKANVIATLLVGRVVCLMSVQKLVLM